MTKLFQNKDTTLRRMVYLTIKEMATLADDVIIVTSSLLSDMTGRQDLYRASAVRALCKITDSSMLQSIERHLKQAIVSSQNNVSSAALVSALHLQQSNFDVVKRWVNEVQQALRSRSIMVQYHALGLLYNIKRRDRLAVSKVVLNQIKASSLRSPYALCLLIRYAASIVDDANDTDRRAVMNFLDSCLHNKSEIVVYEAARALVSLEDVSARDLAPAVSVLQLFLGSPRATLRFGAVRVLNKVRAGGGGACILHGSGPSVEPLGVRRGAPCSRDSPRHWRRWL